MVQSGSVVRAVARHGYYCTMLLQQVDQPLLVRRSGAAHHLQYKNPLECLLVAQGGEVRTRYLRLGGRPVVPDTYLPRYLYCRRRRVTRHYLDVYARVETLSHGSRHVCPYRVAYRRNALKCQSAACVEM